MSQPNTVDPERRERWAVNLEGCLSACPEQTREIIGIAIPVIRDGTAGNRELHLLADALAKDLLKMAFSRSAETRSRVSLALEDTLLAKKASESASPAAPKSGSLGRFAASLADVAPVSGDPVAELRKSLAIARRG